MSESSVYRYTYKYCISRLKQKELFILLLINEDEYASKSNKRAQRLSCWRDKRLEHFRVNPLSLCLFFCDWKRPKNPSSRLRLYIRTLYIKRDSTAVKPRSATFLRSRGQ